MMRNILILYMYKHALHDYNSDDVKATPNHTHHLTWPHPRPDLTTSELPEPPLLGMCYLYNLPTFLGVCPSNLSSKVHNS